MCCCLLCCVLVLSSVLICCLVFRCILSLSVVNDLRSDRIPSVRVCSPFSYDMPQVTTLHCFDKFVSLLAIDRYVER